MGKVPEKLIDAKEAASILCLAPKTIYELALKRELPCVRMGKRSVRFKPSAIQLWIEEHSEGGK